MAEKQVKANVKLQIPGGAATPAPPVGQVLGPQGINLMEFCKQFNAKTAARKGETVPVVVTVYKDNTFEFVLKTPPTSELIKKKAKVAKGSSTPPAKVGSISWADVEEIAKIKLPDLNAVTMEEAKRVVAGTARSMGIEVQ
jgi:large subunit ribosomal protein L11